MDLEAKNGIDLKALVFSGLILVVFAGLAVLGWQVNAAPAAPAADGRTVKVIFRSLVHDDLPVEFYPDDRVQTVIPGRNARNLYHFVNTSDEVVRFRPVHAVAPSAAASDFIMSVCFCFDDQEIGPGESIDFPIVYRLAEDLDPRVPTVHVSYNLHAIAAEEMRLPAAGQVSPGDQLREMLERQGGQKDTGDGP